ncbi:MAG: Clp protease N-terminal domain-containing protein [Patescibacteria group bacterium]
MFTDSASRAMQVADRKFRQLKHPRFQIEHLLLGLAQDGAGKSAKILKDLGVDLVKHRSQLEKLAGQIENGVAKATVKNVLERAIDNRAQFDNRQISSEHLLFAAYEVWGGSEPCVTAEKVLGQIIICP